MRIYKKVLFFLAVIIFLSSVEGCQKRGLESSFAIKPKTNYYSSFPEYKLKNKRSSNICRIQRNENKVPKESFRNQKKFQKEHLNRQTKEVQERIKKSKKESDKINYRGKTFIKRFWFTINNIF